MKPGTPRPLVFPPKGWCPRLWLYEQDTVVQLDDWSWRRRLGFGFVTGLIALCFLPLVLLSPLMIYQASQPPKPGHAPTNLTHLLLGLGVMLIFVPALWAILMALLGCNRRLRVRVDRERRLCVVRSRMLGFTRQRVVVDLRHADWHVDAAGYHPPAKESLFGVALIILGLFLGPLGWLLLAFGGRRSVEQSTGLQDAARLCLSENGVLLACVTTGDETTVTDFLTAWDRLKAGG